MGKWHLGTRPKFFPTRHGFDQWFGIPYSNDNSKYHPVLAAEMPPLPWGILATPRLCLPLCAPLGRSLR